MYRIEDTVGPYHQLLMDTLAGLLDTTPTKVKAVATGEVGSTTHVSESAFLPYFNQTMQRMSPFL